MRNPKAETTVSTVYNNKTIVEFCIFLLTFYIIIRKNSFHVINSYFGVYYSLAKNGIIFSAACLRYNLIPYLLIIICSCCCYCYTVTIPSLAAMPKVWLLHWRLVCSHLVPVEHRVEPLSILVL